MRRIKFRGKSKDTGEWLYGALIPNGKKSACIAPFKKALALESVKPETVGQFIGLLDKNGKEIYEGDITKADSGEIYEICWYDDLASFMGEMVYNEKPFMLFDIETAKQTVIGNIHDNPELLT